MDFRNFSNLVRLCWDERDFVKKEILPNKKSLGRRMLIHLAFAHCEAIATALKWITNEDHEKQGYPEHLSTEHWLASMDDEYIIDDEGGFRTREKRVKALPNLLFSLKFAATYQKIAFDPKKVAKWNHVKAAYAIRNRITHPNTSEALSITDQDFEHIEGLECWLTSCLAIVAQLPNQALV